MFDRSAKKPIVWDDEPDDGPSRHILIERTPKGDKEIQLICLSDRHRGKYTHYFRGGTRPCIDVSDCEACAKQISRRWHGYIMVLGLKAGSLFCFEFTRPAYDPLKEYLRVHGTLRGARICFMRHKNKTNGRVMARIAPSGKSEIELPPCPDLDAFLERLWDTPHLFDAPKTDVPSMEEDSFDTWREILNGDKVPPSNGSPKQKRGK